MRNYVPGNSPDETSGESSPGIPFGVQLLSVIAGLIILVMGAESILQDYRLIHKLTHLESEYQKVPGKWLQVKVRQDPSNDSKFYPDVLFEYFVEGKSVWGWRLSLEEHPKPKEFWEKRLVNYKAGDTVTVHLNPTDAKDSFVEMKTDGIFRAILKGVVGVAFCVFGAILLLIPLGGWLKKLRPAKRIL